MNKFAWERILTPVLGIVLGGYLLARPWSATNTLCILMGWLIFGGGLAASVSAVIRQHDTLISDPTLPISAAVTVVGVYFILHPGVLIDLVGMMIAVFLLIEGMVNLQNAVQRKRYGNSLWWVPLVLGVACVGLGLMALFATWAYTAMVMRTIGGLLVFSGTLNLLLILFFTKKVE